MVPTRREIPQVNKLVSDFQGFLTSQSQHGHWCSTRKTESLPDNHFVAYSLPFTALKSGIALSKVDSRPSENGHYSYPTQYLVPTESFSVLHLTASPPSQPLCLAHGGCLRVRWLEKHSSCWAQAVRSQTPPYFTGKPSPAQSAEVTFRPLSLSATPLHPAEGPAVLLTAT